MAWSMAPLIDVPPPNSWRGAASIAAASASIEASSLTSIQGTTCDLHGRAGPLHHRHGDRLPASRSAPRAAGAGCGRPPRSPASAARSAASLTLPEASTASTSCRSTAVCAAAGAQAPARQRPRAIRAARNASGEHTDETHRSSHSRRLSSRASCPGSIVPLAPARRLDRWIPGMKPRDDTVAYSLETLTSLLVMNSSSAGWPFSVAAMPRLMAATMSPGFSTRSP